MFKSPRRGKNLHYTARTPVRTWRSKSAKKGPHINTVNNSHVSGRERNFETAAMEAEAEAEAEVEVGPEPEPEIVTKDGYSSDDDNL